jgi:Holliday junction resolvase RusA-like endonuclease
MSYRLDFELPGLPPTTNGSHGTWWAASTKRKMWRRAASQVSWIRRPKEPLESVALVLTRFSSSRPDRDNLAISFKPVVDGLKDGGIISDDTDEVIVRCDYKWVKESPKKGRIRIEVTEIQGGENGTEGGGPSESRENDAHDEE